MAYNSNINITGNSATPHQRHFRTNLQAFQLSGAKIAIAEKNKQIQKKPSIQGASVYDNKPNPFDVIPDYKASKINNYKKNLKIRGYDDGF